jgi:hypothetical protein
LSLHFHFKIILSHLVNNNCFALDDDATAATTGIHQPAMHGNITTLFSSSATSSSLTAAYSSPPPADTTSARRIVTPAEPVAITTAAATTTKKPAATKRRFNDKSRENDKCVYKSSACISKAVKSVQKALLDSLKALAGEDLINNPRAVQIYSKVINNIESAKLIATSPSAAGKQEKEEYVLSPHILIDNLNANMALLGKEKHQSKFHGHFTSQLLQMLLPNTQNSKIRRANYLKALPFVGKKSMTKAILKKQEFDRLASLAGKRYFISF